MSTLGRLAYRLMSTLGRLAYRSCGMRSRPGLRRYKLWFLRGATKGRSQHRRDNLRSHRRRISWRWRSQHRRDNRPGHHRRISWRWRDNRSSHKCSHLWCHECMCTSTKAANESERECGCFRESERAANESVIFVCYGDRSRMSVRIYNVCSSCFEKNKMFSENLYTNIG